MKRERIDDRCRPVLNQTLNPPEALLNRRAAVFPRTVPAATERTCTAGHWTKTTEETDGRTGREAVRSRIDTPMTTSANRTLKTSIPLALAVLAGSAGAQSSSVVVFGVVDAAVRQANTNAVGGITSLVSGAYSSSRWGFRGQENLGGGLSASFWLESFLNIDTGTQTPAGWQRRSTLSLTSNTLGEIRMGRDYTPTHQNWARFDPFGYVGIGSNQLLILSATGNTPATSAFGANPNDIQRANNGLQYLLPKNPLGVEGGVVVTAREGGLSANDQHKAWGGRLGVSFGPAFVQAAALTTHDSSATSAFKDMGLAGSYTTSYVRLSGGVRRLAYKTSAQNNFLVGMVFPVGVHEIKASWNRAQMHGNVGTVNIDKDRTDQYAVGYVYNLSKRSRLFATAGMMRNAGNARFVIPGAPAATRGGLTSRGFEAGMNHEF